MVTRFWHVFVAATLVLGASIARADDAERQIMLSLRFVEGDAAKPSTHKVLSAPRILTVDGQPATMMVGEEHVLEGSTKIESGLHCQLVPTLRKDGRVLVKVEFTSTQPVADRDDQKTVQGICIRSVVTATPGTPIKVGGIGKGDGVWLELTAEVIDPKAKK